MTVLASIRADRQYLTTYAAHQDLTEGEWKPRVTQDFGQRSLGLCPKMYQVWAILFGVSPMPRSTDPESALISKAAACAKSLRTFSNCLL